MSIDVISMFNQNSAEKLAKVKKKFMVETIIAIISNYNYNIKTKTPLSKS